MDDVIDVSFLLSYQWTSSIVTLNSFQSWSDKNFLFLEIMMFLTIYMNSLFNPMLYIIRNTKYKKELKLIQKELFAKWNLRQRVGQGSSIKFKRASAVSVGKSALMKKDTLWTTADEQC